MPHTGKTDDDYRQAAQRACQHANKVLAAADVPALQVTIGPHAWVQRMADGGAFVEIVVFVPDTAEAEVQSDGPGTSTP